jgi:hypothetical protein
MEEILVAKLMATSAKQIGMFLAILAVVSAAIVAFIIYTMTLGKIREIAVLTLLSQDPDRCILNSTPLHLFPYMQGLFQTRSSCAHLCTGRYGRVDV